MTRVTLLGFMIVGESSSPDSESLSSDGGSISSSIIAVLPLSFSVKNAFGLKKGEIIVESAEKSEKEKGLNSESSIPYEAAIGLKSEKRGNCGERKAGRAVLIHFRAVT